ncbi:MAG: hypothetical protein ABW123_13945 [Cystobacter sp.]
MRRDPFPSYWVVSASLLGLGLLLWWPFADPRGASTDERLLSREADPPDPRPVHALAVRASPRDARARSPPPPLPVSSAATWYTPPPASFRPVLTRASSGSASTAAQATHASLLPRAAQDIAPDGLPAAATNCQWEAGALVCGSCRSSGDCPQDQGCLINRETRQLECMASDCVDDSHCDPGTTCRELKTGTSNADIRRCTPVGERGEGDSCDPDFISRSGACREGLRCLNQVCTRPCEPGGPESCPAGHTCTSDVDGAGCVPDCEQLGCAAGQHCKRLPEGGNRCLAQVTGTCPETACGEGERCLMDGTRGRGSFWCARVCESFRPEGCAAGEVCGWAGGTTSACFRQCDPKRLDSCGEGWMCATISEDLSLWGCRPSAFD